MIRVWTDGEPAGVLDRFKLRGSTFAYEPTAVSDRAVSRTMPVRTASYDYPFDVLPIFEMNLPEGALRERLRLTFAKATGSFTDLDLLSVVGRSQLGRIRYTGTDAALDEAVPFQSVDEILASRRGGQYYRHLIERFASFSGVSGVQPKFLIRDERSFGGETLLHDSFRGATHIVKFWDAELPQLAANEFFCLQVAEACGLVVPKFRLADDASALVVERFDLRPDGAYSGFEDFCVLNARRTEEKYKGSYETAIIKRFGQFADPFANQHNLRLFKLLALNCALRNGDAHLKNFAILYDSLHEPATLAPVYDIVTTTVYQPQDRMALTLNGSTEWPSYKQLLLLGETRLYCKRHEVLEAFDQIANAVAEVGVRLREYMAGHPAFHDTGARMLEQWAIGTESLRISPKG